MKAAGRGQRAARELHRKVLDKALLKSKTHNLKDAFRQYDIDRSGDLNRTEFHTLMRDHGFIDNDADRLIQFLDPDGQKSVSFRSFLGDFESGIEQNYQKTSPKKQQLAAPLAAKKEPPPKLKSNVKAAPTGAKANSTAATSDDPMEVIRGKLRQRVMGHNKSIREVFMEFDGDGNGNLDYSEFGRFMAAYKFTPDETETIIEYLDRDYSGTIDYDEFAAGLLFYRPPPVVVPPPTNSAVAGPVVSPTSKTTGTGASNSVVKAIVKEIVDKVQSKLREFIKKHRGENVDLYEEFAKFAVDGTDSLDIQEFGAFLVGIGIKLPPEQLSALFHELDVNNTQSVEFSEFMKLCSARVQNSGDGNDARRVGDINGTNALSTTRSDTIHSEEDDNLFVAFNKYDIDGSGYLDYGEFSQLMRDHGFSESEILQVMKQIDQDEMRGNNRVHSTNDRDPTGSTLEIDYEALAYALKAKNWSLVDQRRLNARNEPRKHPKKATKQPSMSDPVYAQWLTRVLRQQRSLEDAFRQHDTDGSGELDVDEFRRFMKHYGMKRSEDVDALIEYIDTDGSGSVSFREFSRFFGKSVKASLQLSKTQRQDDGHQQGRGQRSPNKHPEQTTKAQSGRDDQPKKRLTALREQEIAFIRRVLRDQGSIEAAFREFDRDQSNELDYEEFRDLMNRYGVTDAGTISLLLKKLDVDNSGAVDLDEFLSVFNLQRLETRNDRAHLDVKVRTNTEKLPVESPRRLQLAERWTANALKEYRSIQEAFSAFSRDGGETLSHEDFRDLMATFGITRVNEIDALIDQLDADDTGAISYESFDGFFAGMGLSGENGNGVAARESNIIKKKKSSVAVRQSDNDRRSVRQRAVEVKWVEHALACHQTIEDAFYQYDDDDSGDLDHDEFRCLMKRYGVTNEDDIDRLIAMLDTNESGTIDFNEFSAIFHPSRLPQGRAVRSNEPIKLTDVDEVFNREELESVLEIERDLAKRIAQQSRDLRLAFRKFDLNGNGQLEYKEFRAVLKSFRLPEMEIRKVIRHLDRDVSGFIDYKEFIAGFSVAHDGASPAGGVRRRSGQALGRNSLSKADASRAKRGSGLPSPTKKRQSPSVEIAAADDTNGLPASAKRIDSLSIAARGEAIKKRMLARIQATHGTVQSVFRRYDIDRVGYLTHDQFLSLATDFEFADDDAMLLRDLLDCDGSGTIEYEEFLSQLVVRDGV